MAGGFDSLGLMPELIRAVDDLDWHLPTDVQDEAIPLILGGGDVMAAAETGSGKTAAFCLPMIQCVHERLREDSALKLDGSRSSSSRSSSSSSGRSSNGSSSDMAVDADPPVPVDVPDVRVSNNDKDNIVIVAANGLSANSNADKQWAGARATHGVKGGKCFYEATVKGAGICRVGFSTMAAHHELGRDMHGFGYGGTGMKSLNNAFEAYGEKYGNGDVIGCALDLDESTISFYKNGKALGVAFQLPDSMVGMAIFPAFVLKGCGIGLNFGAEVFRFPAPEGHCSVLACSTSDLVCASSKEAFVVTGKRLPLAIILEPSRDLAEQVYQAVLDMTRYITSPELKALLVVGGDDTKKLQKALKSGVDIVVGTTGKVVDMLKSGALNLSQIKFFILDEADRLIETENLSGIMQLYNACPSGGVGDNRLQVCFFSATLHSPEITELAGKLCVNPTWVDLKGVDSVPETVHHVIYRVNLQRDGHLVEGKTAAVIDDVHPSSPSSTEEIASKALKGLKMHVLLGIIDKFKMAQCMIFCRTNADCDNLETFLCAHGGGQKFRGMVDSGKEHAYSCCVLAGMRSMQERRANLEAFKEGSVRFLICTDVAARGIDIKNLPYMINMTLPDEAENYIHRIGRVGRAERMGLAISIVAGAAVVGETAAPIKEKVWYHRCANRGKGCSNRILTDAGGCCIWYDEDALLGKIQTRLKQSIAEIDTSFNLPPEIAVLGAEYGEDVKPVGGVTNIHLQLLGPTVIELGNMEILSQNIFLDIRKRNWAGDA